VSAEHEIDRLFERWNAAVIAKDVEALAVLTTEDCEFWTNAASPLKGRDGLRATLPAFYARFEYRQEFDRLELIVDHDLAFVRGTERNYLRPMSGGPEIEHLQRAFMVIRREGDGQWRFARGMTNLLPPQPPAAPAGGPA
jgi:uncharacterized protein (TIGR02246 family)